MLEYLAFSLLSQIAPRIPPRIAYHLFGWVGVISYWLLPRRRANVRRNLSIVLRDRVPELNDLAREVFREGGRYYYDNFRIPALSDRELEMVVSLEGWDNLENALSAGKGVVLVTAHLGSPVLVGQILAARRCKVVTVAEAIEPPQLLDLMIRIRGSRGIRILPFSRDVVRELKDALARNEIVGLLADRDIQKNGAKVRFFGVETTMATGPVMLALRTGAALVPAFTYREGAERFSAKIEAPLEMERTGTLRDIIQDSTEKLARVFEKAIAKKPEQWIVFEPVWPETAVDDRLGAIN